MAAEMSPLSNASAQTDLNPDLSADTNPTSETTAASGLNDAPAPKLSPQDSVDFLMHPVEIAKGLRAAENYLSSFRSEESRKTAEEALETLATVVSGGKCDSLEFPWQQIQPYHGAAALTILKEKGTPARVEALRCRKDSTRSYRVVPEAYPARQVQKIRSTLSKVIEECTELGFLENTEFVEEAPPQKSAKKSTRGAAASKTSKAATKASARGRLLGDGELRALVAASAMAANADGRRDAVLFSLVYRGLKIAEITSLTVESVKFSNKTGACQIVAAPTTSGGRGRRVELTNDELIILEDWLDERGDGAGPLLCTTGKTAGGKRLTIAMLKEICTLRAEQAKVAEFVPNDLSRSAEALSQYRKNVRRKSAKHAQESLSAAEQVLFDGDLVPDESGEMIRFPFLGLSS
ncbi:MAG: hypothetical protein AB8G23_17535 [Myxococcota bacterium]